MMKAALKSFLTMISMACTAMMAKGVEIRSYAAADHDRFTGFPAAPVINASSFFDGNKVRGIGWRADQTQWQFALITRSHVVCATHAAPPNGSEIQFLNDSGQIVSRLVTSKANAKNDDNSNSDLTLVTLNAPIDFDEGVSPFPYLDLPTEAQYIGKQLIAFGKFAKAGKGEIHSFETISGSAVNPTHTLRFLYNTVSGGDDDANLEGGDSGSPSLHKLASGQMCLVGTHSAIGSSGNFDINYDAFVPEYVGQLDTLLAPDGYRMTPVNTATTTLSGTETVVTSNPRKGNPLSITFELENTGANPTGNLEVDFQFASGEEPDSITGTNWVASGGGSDWTLRHPLLTASSSTTLTLSWSAAPLVGNLGYDIDWRSDKAPGASLSPSHALGPSFNEWAAGLSSPGLTDNPDGDQFLNVSEYAFGSDPEDGANVLPNGEPARPNSGGSGNMVVLTYPERSDAASRGLSYIPQWSSDLVPTSWSASPPSGLSSSTSAYDPAVPGLVKRTLSWPSDELCQFIRIGVMLDE